jgi:hypothetical protein
MLRVNRTKKELMKLDRRSLPELGLTEPYDLQQMIRNGTLERDGNLIRRTWQQDP